MATDRPVRADHGVKVVETRDARTIVLLVTALLLIAFAGIMVLVLALGSPTPPPPPRVATAAPPSPSAAGAAAPEPSHTATAPTHASAPPPHENASAPHVRPLRPARPPASVGTAATNEAGATQPQAEVSDTPTGILAFPPPGTKPLKRGIVVPDGFDLPPGYVRHYQTTDDGEQLPPILMIHPDFEPIDEQGNPLPMPPDRVVPPELAPPGMPLEMLKLPGDEETGRRTP